MKGFKRVPVPVKVKPQVLQLDIIIPIRTPITREPQRLFKIPCSRSGVEGLTTLIVPGLSGLGRIPFEKNIGPLAQLTGGRVMALDMPPLDGFNPSLMLGVEILEECMNQISPASPVNLIGYSAGGIIVLNFAFRKPERIRKLVLVDSAGLGREICLNMRLLSLPVIGNILARLRLKPTEQSVQKSLKKLFHDPNKIPNALALDILAQRADWGFKKWREWYIEFLRAGVNFWGQKIIVLDQLRTLSEKIPILVVWGEHDRILSCRQMILAKANLPKVKIQVMENCGHWPQMEKPKEFSQVAADFLR